MNLREKNEKKKVLPVIQELVDGQDLFYSTGISVVKRTIDGKVEMLAEEPVTLIPYALWNNRGPGQMRVWLPTTAESAQPLPAPTIAFRSVVRASKVTKALTAVNDQLEPANSNDHSIGYYHWWPDKNTWEWVEYDLDRPTVLTGAKVYWFDDGPDGGCRVPDEWEILYLNGNIWEPVSANTPYTVTKDDWDSIDFDPVATTAIKIKVKLNRNYSSGIYEWIVK